MAAKVPIRAVFDGSTATGLSEFQSTEFIALAYGGLGASLSIGSAGQVIKVNSAADAMEFGAVEAVLNIDGMTDGSGITIVDADKFAISDGGTEKYILASQIKTYVAGAGATAITALDIDGGTDIGAAIVDADLFIVDDGAGGTNRKTAASRIATYVGASAGAFSLANLDIDGGTDIGAAIVDADLFIVDDGAGGTNRKVAASRIKTYVHGTGAVDITTLDIDGGTDIGAAIVDADLFIVDDGAGGTNRKTAASRLKTYIEASAMAVTGNVTSTGTVEPAGDTASGDNAAIGYTSAEGLILTGQGSTNDITFKNDADTAVISIPTGTTNVTVAGDLTISGDDLTMGTNTSGAALIADGTNFNPVVISGDIAISTAGVAAIGSGVIVAADIASNAVTSAKINADAVTSAKIADDAIDSEHYTDGSIDNAHLAANSVDSDNYVDGSIDNAHIADNAIDSEHYADGSIDNAHIADDAIDSEHYAAGSIDTAHIADDQITLAKMAGLARGKFIYGNSSGNPTALAVGTADQLLTADGTDFSWSDPAAGGAGYFLGGASGATGDTTAGLEDIFRVNSATVDNSCTIASSTNASAAGPLTVSSGVTVTVAGVLVVL